MEGGHVGWLVCELSRGKAQKFQRAGKGEPFDDPEERGNR